MDTVGSVQSGVSACTRGFDGTGLGAEGDGGTVCFADAKVAALLRAKVVWDVVKGGRCM